MSNLQIFSTCRLFPTIFLLDYKSTGKYKVHEYFIGQVLTNLYIILCAGPMLGNENYDKLYVFNFIIFFLNILDRRGFFAPSNIFQRTKSINFFEKKRMKSN